MPHVQIAAEIIWHQLDESLRTHLAYIEKLTRTPHEITDADFASLKKEFFVHKYKRVTK